MNWVLRQVNASSALGVQVKCTLDEVRAVRDEARVL